MRGNVFSIDLPKGEGGGMDECFCFLLGGELWEGGGVS